MPSLDDAILLAVQGHKGQVDKAGRPYILHVLRVMLHLDSEADMIAGILHDLVEDTAYTLDDLEKLGYSNRILRALDCLTKRKGESYNEFINRVKQNPIARRVKMVDLEDNMDVTRLSDPTAKDIARIQKYKSAMLRIK